MNTPEWIVREVTPREDHTLLISFADGSRKIYDVKPLLGKKIYASLNNIGFFMTAKEQYGTVVWDEMTDIDPELLYEHGILA